MGPKALGSMSWSVNTWSHDPLMWLTELTVVSTNSEGLMLATTGLDWTGLDWMLKATKMQNASRAAAEKTKNRRLKTLFKMLTRVALFLFEASSSSLSSA